MAIKVIGDKPVKTKRHVCTNCGYELEYTNVDLKWDNGDYSTPYYLQCPRRECGYINRDMKG